MAKKKNKLAFPVGIITVILAVVGLVTVVNFTVDFVKNKKDNTALKSEYEDMLKPVVMFDPDPFDDLTQADETQLVYAAIWNLLTDEEGADKYGYSTGETVGIVVPQSDIEQSFIYLFGSEIDITSLHSSIDMTEYDITYDAALQSYILPITGVDSAYIPRVTDITKQGSSHVLTVEYISSKAWADVDDEGYNPPAADKVMTITMRSGSDGMYVSSIQNANPIEVTTKGETEYYSEEEVTEEEEEVTEETEELQYVPVTDENGEPVTDEEGNEVTELVTSENTEDNTDETESGEVSEDEETTEEEDY